MTGLVQGEDYDVDVLSLFVRLSTANATGRVRSVVRIAFAWVVEIGSTVRVGEEVRMVRVDVIV